SIAFLENGDLAIVKGEPVYRVYIFSKSNSSGKHKWTCKNSIELEKSTYIESYYISKKGKLFMSFRMPFVVTQWDLITRKFDMQYILNWDLTPFDLCGLKIELNGDNTLLAMACYKGLNKSIVYIYLTKSGMMVANS
ncbi:15259_t:CDS:1, partial [Cetraspora pellucida]